MDKYEYKLKTEQMLELMEDGAYDKAAEIADIIDWRRVKNASMLISVSDIYEMNEEFQKSYEILKIAYEREAGGRKVVYRLGNLALELGDVDEAIDYYDEFVEIAPKDPNQYILRYKILRRQNEPIEEQIEALEEFKKAEYIEKWAFELAKLYQEAGMTAECLEECDDLILWFSEGTYVYQAMELKMQYKPLTPSQLEKYNHRLETKEEMPKRTQFKKPQPKRGQVTVADKLAVTAGMQGIAEALAAQETADEEEYEYAGEADEEALADEPEETAKKSSIIGATMALGEALESLVHGLKKDSFPKEDETEEYEEAPAYVEAGEPVIEEAEEEPETVKPVTNIMDAPTMRLPDTDEILAKLREDKTKRERQLKQGKHKKSQKPVIDDVEEMEGQMNMNDILSDWEEEEAEKPEAPKKVESILPPDIQKMIDEIENGIEPEPAPRVVEEPEDSEVYENKGNNVESLHIDEELEEEPFEEEPEEDFDEEEYFEEEPEEDFDEEEYFEEEPEEEYEEEYFEEEPEDEYEEEYLEEEPEDDYDEEDYEEESEDDYDEEDYEEESEDDYDEEDYEEEPEDDYDEEYFEEEPEDDYDEEDYEEEPEDDYDEEDYEEEPEDDYDEEDYEEELEDDYDEEDYEDNLEDELEREPEDSHKTDKKAKMAAGAAVTAGVAAAGAAEVRRRKPNAQSGPKRRPDAKPERKVKKPEIDDREIPDDDIPDLLTQTAPLSRKETAKMIATGKTAPLPVDEISNALSMSDTGFIVHGRYDLATQSGIGTRAGLTEDQKKLFSYFVPVRGMSEQLVDVLEQDKNCTNRKGTSITGNLLIIGRKGSGKTVLAVDVVKAIQKQRKIKQGKVAIVTGDSLNKKRISEILDKLYGGALIIEKAGKMNEKTVARLNKAMEQDTGELLIVLEEQRKPLDRLLTSNKEFRRKFTARLEVPIFINDELVTFGQTYARENGYKIDEMGILALYSRIDALQREDHAVTVSEVKAIMDEAQEHSQKASAKKLVKRVFGRSTDESDRIILSEKDFNI